MHVGHEAVEMRAPLGPDLDRVEEDVHQHRLAAPDRAIDVETAQRLDRLHPDESGEGAGLCVGAIALQPEAQRLEPFGQIRLGGIVFEAVVVDERAVTLRDRRHGSGLPSPRPSPASGRGGATGFGAG